MAITLKAEPLAQSSTNRLIKSSFFSSFKCFYSKFFDNI